MRSGHYKLDCSRSGGRIEGEGIVSGHFRNSCNELLTLSPVQSEVLQYSMKESVFQFSTISSNGGRRPQDMIIDVCEEQNLKDGRKDGIFRHRSCENVNLLPRGTVNRVEQKVRSLLLKGESNRRGDLLFYNTLDGCEEGYSEDQWQCGRVVTKPKKNRLTSAHSHSALHTLSTNSDSASCLSASSGYSSSSSSSYGSFKRNGSDGSDFQRHRNHSFGNHSPVSDNSRLLFVDNPLYDIIPAVTPHRNVEPQFWEPSGGESLSSGEFSLGEWCVPSLPSRYHDSLVLQCKEYLEKRLESSERLKRKWFLYVSDEKPFEFDKNIDSELISKGDAVIDSKFNGGFGGGMTLGVESNITPSEDLLSNFHYSKSESKNELDKKMELLRQEIAILIQKDDRLFKQLLALHDSISALKSQSNLQHLLTLRPLTPSDLDSFTEEEEADEGDQHRHQKMLRHLAPTQGEEEENSEEQSLSLHEAQTMLSSEVKPLEDEEDEGHGTDLSLGHTPSPSPSPNSTLSSNSSKDLSYSRSLYSEMSSALPGSFTRCRKSYAPNARNRRRASSVHRQTSPLDCSTTTALVVVHTDDEDALLNYSRARAHSFTPLTMLNSSNDGLLYTLSSCSRTSRHSPGEGGSPQSSPSTNAQTEVKQRRESELCMTTVNHYQSCPIPSTALCASSSRPSLIHPPPYREALIM